MVEKKAKYLLIVRMDVNADGEKRLNEWYDNVHIPALIKVPGVLSGRRFAAIQGSPKYTAIYEFDRPGVTESEAWNKAVEMTPRPKDLVITNFSREIHQLIYP
jgi:hypothetical protein